MSEVKPLVPKDDGWDAEDLRRLKKYQPVAFIVTFFGYFMAHFSRKCYSTVKQQLEGQAGYEAWILSTMDSAFMFSYSIGNIVNGKLGDTFNPTTILAMGLFGSAVCLMLIGVGLWGDFYHISPMLGNGWILVVYLLFGYFQATGGPVGTAVMKNWFCDPDSDAHLGTIFGFWTCHQYGGDITAALCTAWVLSAGLHYTWALVIPSITNVIWAGVTLTLKADPADDGIVTPDAKKRAAKMEAERKEAAEEGEAFVDEGVQAIGFFDAFKIPMVVQYALAFGFFKLVNYCLFFWLPYFLGKSFDPVTANLIASLYSVGMMPGGIIVGYVSDLLGGRRAVVIGVFMSLLIVLLAIFAAFSESDALGVVPLLAMLACMGILIGGPNNIITSAVAADLAVHPSVRGNSKSVGTVTGIINGCGSIVASAGLNAVGPLSEAYGWAGVWVYLIACTAVGTGLIGPMIWAELFPSQ